MNKSTEIKLPVLENWIRFEEGQKSKGHLEYEFYSDAIIIGSSNESDFGPYQFINTVPPRSSEIRVSIILRVDNRLPDSNEFLPKMDKTDTSLYHGGGLADEVASLVSLAMGTRIMAGKMIREFSPEGGRFGRPVGWYPDVVTPMIKPQYNRHVLPVVLGEKRITSLESFKNLFQLTTEEVAVLVKSARLYQNALWIAESDASLAWVMLVSAVETAANHWSKGDDSAEQRLEYANEELFTYLQTLGNSVVTEVSNAIADSLGSTKKFVDFVLNYFPQAPEKRPSKYLQHPWDEAEIKKTLKKIYKYRSQALHGGTPFPWPMCEPPYHPKESEAPAEKPYGLAAYTNSGMWIAEDTPMLLNAFEYIARNSLLLWWKSMCDSKSGQSIDII